MQDVHNISRFLELHSSSVVHQCYADFHEPTSNAVLKTMVCGICAWEVNVVNDGLWLVNMQDLPVYRLTPSVPHLAHNKFHSGMLLKPTGVVAGASGKEEVQVCGSC